MPFNQFQSTPSARRATWDKLHQEPVLDVISIHALREEGDGLWVTLCPWCHQFQSTPSARRATAHINQFRKDLIISIHALREEGDLGIVNGVPHDMVISIHALREEGDSKSGEKIHHVCSIIHTCAQFEKELYEGSGEMQNKSC